MSCDTTTATGANPHSLKDAPTFIISLPVSSIEASKSFYANIGGSEFPLVPVPEYSDPQTVSFRLPQPNAFVCLMLHDEPRFREFMRPDAKPVIDANRATEVILSITCKTKEEVDGWIERVVAAGGKADPYSLKNYGVDFGMYNRSWADPDGHVWECVAMLGFAGCHDAAAAKEEPEKK